VRYLGIDMLSVANDRKDPRVVVWGDKHIILYNEAALPIMGNKHPHALGRPPTVAFGELWPNVLPIVSLAYNEGKSTKLDKMELLIRRREDLVVRFIPCEHSSYGLRELTQFSVRRRGVFFVCPSTNPWP